MIPPRELRVFPHSLAAGHASSTGHWVCLSLKGYMHILNRVPAMVLTCSSSQNHRTRERGRQPCSSAEGKVKFVAVLNAAKLWVVVQESGVEHSDLHV